MFTIEFLLRELFTEFSEVRECTFNIGGTFYKLSINHSRLLITIFILMNNFWSFSHGNGICTEIPKPQWWCSFLLTLHPVGLTHMGVFRDSFAPSAWFLMEWKCTHNVSGLQKNKMQSLQIKKCPSKNLMMSVPSTMLCITNYNQFINLVVRTWCP